MTFNAQFNFCYPQPFQVFRSLENRWNQTLKDQRSPSRELRFSPLSTHDLSVMGGMFNLPGFFLRSTYFFKYFDHRVFPAAFASAAIPCGAVHFSAPFRSVNRFFEKIFADRFTRGIPALAWEAETIRMSGRVNVFFQKSRFTLENF